jgi:predicted aldo/keto reductase-like oxidoreductase
MREARKRFKAGSSLALRNLLASGRASDDNASRRTPIYPQQEETAMSNSNNRREFLQTSLAAGTALGLAGLAQGADEAGGKGLPTRALGKTGEKVSMICLGGWHIGSVKDHKEAIRIMHAAIDNGLTFFDNAWDYHDGGSEEIMGRALAESGYRKKCFLMTKNCGRDARTVQQHLDDSHRRLKTDVIDLMQFHEINYDNDPDWIVEKGGLGVLVKAKKMGKIRYLGFTGHKDPHIHLKMLPRHEWDTAQMPINVCDWHYRSFVHHVVPAANKRGIGVIGMKSLGGGSGGKGRLVTEGVCKIEEALNYSLSQAISSLVVGIDSMKVLEQDLRIAREHKPMEESELKSLLARVKTVAGDGRHERFKSTQLFDGVYHRKQHGLTKEEVEKA